MILTDTLNSFELYRKVQKGIRSTENEQNQPFSTLFSVHKYLLIFFSILIRPLHIAVQPM